MNIESETEEDPWRSYFRKTHVPYWCNPAILIVFFGLIAIAQTISIFVMGYNPRLGDWVYYAFNIVAAIAGVALLWSERRKRRQSE